MTRNPKTQAKLLLSAATAALLLATGACSSNGGGQGLSFAAAPPMDGGGPVTETGGGEPGGSPMDPTPGGVTDTSPPGGGGGGSGGGGGAGGGGSGGGGGGNNPPAAPRDMASGSLDRVVTGVDTLLATGNADLAGLLDPLRPVVSQVDSALNPVGQVQIANQTLIGPGGATPGQALGVSALSNGAPTGQLASLGLLNADGAATLTLAGNAIIPPAALPGVPGAGGGATTELAALSLGDTAVLNGSSALVGVGVGSTTPVVGTLASANLGANGAVSAAVGGSQLNGSVLGLTPVTNAVGGVVGQVSTQLATTGLNSNGVLGVTAGGSSLGTAAPVLLGVNAGSAAPVTGQLATVGVLQGSSLVSASSPILTGLGLGEAVSQATAGLPAAPATGGGLGGLLGGLGR